MHKKAISQCVALLLFYFIVGINGCSLQSPKEITNTAAQTNIPLDSSLTPISVIEAAFANQDSNLNVTVKGAIIRILNDDTIGENHQRFIIQLSNQQTLLIEHNIDIAPRVAGIQIGSLVYVHGDYVWNDQGGLMHWTHHDPNNVHENGWIIFNDVKYQ